MGSSSWNDHPLRAARHRCAATDTGPLIHLEILGDGRATVQGTSHVGAGLLLSFTPVDPGEVQPSIRITMQGIEGMLNDSRIVVHRDGGLKRLPAIGRAAQSQFRRKGLLRGRFRMGQSPCDKHVLPLHH